MKTFTYLKIWIIVFTLFLSIKSSSQTTLLSETFDSTTNFTVSNGSLVTIDNTTSVSAPSSLRFTGSGSTNATFNNIDITGYSDVNVTISFKSIDVDNNENLYLDISYDNGSNYSSTKLIDGQNGSNGEDWDWGEIDNDGGAVGSNPYTFSVPDSNTQLKIRVSSDNLESGEYFYIDDLVIEGTAIPMEPEIEVYGDEDNDNNVDDGEEIFNGDLYPSTFNNTKYGSLDLGNTSTKTYTINNTGLTTLSISSISLSNTTDFEIVAPFHSSTVASGGSTDLNIQYTASSGKHSSTVTIESDDDDEPSFSFVIRASTRATSDTSLWSVTNITADSELNYPYEMTYGPDGFLWITERIGKQVVKVSPADGTNSKTTMLDLSSVVYQTAGQDGLMGMAIHPDLYTDINTSNNFVYLAYTYDSGGRKLRIARYTYNSGTGLLNSGSATTLIDGIDASNDHNSGRLIIGPDLKLYYTIGDQGANQFSNACNPIQSQDLPTSPSDYDPYKGKILRLNLDGSIPSDNPTLNAVQSHVYTYGHRNPQGIIFGSNGKLYSSEHGAKVDDELNIITAGKNYGWPEIAGYYDNLAYGYCNWSSTPGGCSTSGFSDHNCPSGVTSASEFDSYPSGAPSDFEPPIGTYDSTTNYDPDGNWLTWPTVAPSSIDIYEGGSIPNWGESLLISTLKEGTIFRAKLNVAGDALVDITTDNQFEEFHSSNDRYRDFAMDPDGVTFYAITDTGGTTSGPSGSSSVSIDNPGVIMKFKYIGPTSTTTYYTDADGDNYGDINDTTGTEFGSDPGAGYSLTNNDCDDTDANEFPGQTWYIDADGDDYGTSSATACERPTNGFLLSELSGTGTDDCDDTDANEFPGQTWYIDADGDDYGTSSATACERPTNGFLLSELSGTGTDDCDDTPVSGISINPGQTEIPGNAIDDDCNPSTPDGALGIDDFSLNSVSISPNPFNNIINIKLPLNFNNSEFTVKVFDLNGKLIFNKNYLNINGKINVSGLSKLEEAIYLVKIINIQTSESITKRLIKH